MNEFYVKIVLIKAMEKFTAAFVSYKQEVVKLLMWEICKNEDVFYFKS
jgi:hypothetical protein